MKPIFKKLLAALKPAWHWLRKLPQYFRLQRRLTQLIWACIAFGWKDRAFNLILRQQRVKGKMRGKHCYPVYRDFGGGEDVLTEWRTEPKAPGNQMRGLYYRTSYTQ